MKAQEIFDTVVAHLRKQGKKSMGIADNGNEMCKYRSEDGLMCAVGCLINDLDYDLDMEGESLYEIIKEYPLPSIKKLAKHYKLCKNLQQAHDYDDVEHWEKEFKSIAKIHHCKYTAP